MTTRWYLFALVMLLLAFTGCNSVETFDASIMGFEKTSSRGVPSLPGLEIDPPSENDGPLAIRFNLCEGIEKKCETATFVSTSEKPGINRMVNLFAGNYALSAKDLRVGQKLTVNHALRGDLEPQALVIKDYSPPHRFLRLRIKLNLLTEKEQDELAKLIESLIIAHLSWRLPSDIGIVTDREITENLNIVGDLDVIYSKFQVDTPWMIRKQRTEERLMLKTQLLDPNLLTNWLDLKFSGGSQPLGNDAFSYSYESAMMQVPLFEIRSAN